MLFETTIEAPLDILGFKLETKYYASNLYRTIRPLIVADRRNTCEFKICHSQKTKPASAVLFLHKVLPAYLGIGPSNTIAVCEDCRRVAGAWMSDALFFAVTGLRKRKGHSRPAIGVWYRERVAANQTLARAVLEALGERNRRFVVGLLNRKVLPNFYEAYLGLSDVSQTSETVG
jgi:hypothetical protein